MERIRAFLLCAIVALGIGAASAAGASAKPNVLVLEAGEPEAPVNVTDPWVFGLETIALEISDGSVVECSGQYGNQLEGAVVANGAKTDAIEIKQSFIDLHGRLSRPCEESVETGEVHSTYLALGEFPWTVNLRANGIATVKGKAFVSITRVSSPAEEPDSETSVRCDYRASKLAAIEIIEGPLSVTFGGVLRRTSTSPKSCAKTVRFIDKGPAYASDSVRGPYQGALFYPVDAWVR